MSEERIREASWTGSEGSRRREQGVCLPPTKPPNRTPRYRIAAGTKCSISRLSPRYWRDYTTKRELSFDRYEAVRGRLVIFREQGYLIEVRWQDVIEWDGAQ